MQEIDQILKRLEVKSATGYESWRRTQAVQKQKDNKVRMITTNLKFVNIHLLKY